MGFQTTTGDRPQLSGEEVRSSHARCNGFGPRKGHSPFCLHQSESSLGARFCDIASLHPANIALALTDGTTLTYSDLLQRSQKIAGGIRATLRETAGPLAILASSQPEGIEAILGALLAGFPYLPIDSSISCSQLARLIEAAKPVALLTTMPESLPTCFLEQTSLSGVSCLDVSDLRLHSSPGELVSVSPEQPAALFPTSGTTGEPKIVALSHRAILFDIGRQTNDLYLGPDDRFDLLFSLGFSASLAPVFGALLNGAQLHPLDLQSENVRLLDWLEEREITVSTMATSTFRMAVATAPEATGRCPRLRLLSLGGESVLSRDVAAFRATIGGSCVLQNAMAATETRTYAQYFLVNRTEPPDPVPIGWPVWGKEVRLLDENENAISGAGEGEIAIASRYLASGYINDAARTAERFSMEPDGLTVFRTGDRARRSEDGCLTFLGRDDLRVKVHGYRVEQEAIEAAIRRFPGILECAVVARETQPGDLSLAAFYNPEAGAAISEHELQAWLETELPPYMLPAVVIRVDELPRTANRKIDRQLLREQPLMRPLMCKETKPKTIAAKADEPACETMIALWTSVLGHSSFSRDDKFFRAGGDSLKAFQLLFLIEERFGLRIAPNVFREHSTLRQSAALVDKLLADPDSLQFHSRQPQIVPLSTSGERSPVLFVHPISGSAEIYYRVVGQLDPDRPCYGIHAPAYTAAADTGLTIEAMASSYLKASRTLLTAGKAVFAGFSLGGMIAYEMARQHAESGGRALPALMVDITVAVPRSRLQLTRDMIFNLPAWLRHDGLKATPKGLLQRGLRRVRKEFAPYAPLPGVGIGAEVLGRTMANTEACQVMLAALEKYVPWPYSGPVVLLRGKDRHLFNTRDPALGWSAYARNLRLDSLPGSHDTWILDANLAASVEVMRRHLESFD